MRGKMMLLLPLMNEPIFGFVGRDQSIRYERQKNGLFFPLPLSSNSLCRTTLLTTHDY